jgi:hypothetical protein
LRQRTNHSFQFTSFVLIKPTDSSEQQQRSIKMIVSPMKVSSSATNKFAQISAGVIVLGALCIGLCAMMVAQQAGAMSMADQDTIRSSSATVALVENPELTVRVLENLLKSILYSTATTDLQQITK